ncbi:xanthine dehydrogenase family protein molybdopterin-binding subunit [Motiliproteus coralliicola]|uniref:Xanthine dehydrogenase family protein molybdopterin-binding subunit n=1 Tax=Motiliproteus coralliicola TaxID=2283196 RepID=A0A369WJB2_9GAMM|nr:xanthine dehydrogenase family protein molybdopterin-binding subunit [Motiliproteus coralliicola]RDE19525.1 xanthine dehydrogenase family protein molybdopterin-binding subunit [Motiliproteus coralliicola]
MSVAISRRNFLKAGASGAAVLLVGINPRGALAAGQQSTEFNPFVRIDADGMVTVIIKHFEMGQGTTTGLTTLVAEELDADWSRVKPQFAPSDNAKYKNLAFGSQGTGGSTAIANSFMQYRQAGAAARELLVKAAARVWQVAPQQIRVEKGVLSAGNHRGSFGDFVELAAGMEPNPEPILKSPEQFQLIGKQKLPRKDSKAKTNGSARFAMDVKLPGMRYVVILRAPKFGGKLIDFDASQATKISGFVDAKALPNAAGVAVYAENTWAALQARNAIQAQWDLSGAEQRSSDQLVADHRAVNQSPQHQAKSDGTEQVAALVDAAPRRIEAEFSFPFLAHAPMEPLVCVFEPTANGVRVLDGCQFPAIAHGTIAAVLQLKPEQVEIETLYAGGSFGRRATPTADYHVEAALAYALLGQKLPVKLIWSREDDIRGGYYRPMAQHRASIGLDENGQIIGWDHRITAKSILIGSPFESVMVHNGIDHTTIEGVADSLYTLPKMSVGVTNFETPVPVLWWRSVGHTHNAYVIESLIDMLAHETERDPVELRLSLLDRSHKEQARLAGVIEAARDLADWKPGQKRGFAAHYSFNTFVAVVADVSADGDKVHVDKLHIAVDCGVAINPDVIRAQMEGGAGFGLGAVMRNAITLQDGEVVQSNFPDYQPLRMADMPAIEVRIVSSNEAPTGVGEPGVPPTGPAVANAIFAVTGKRILDLPMTNSGLSFV